MELMTFDNDAEVEKIMAIFPAAKLVLRILAGMRGLVRVDVFMYMYACMRACAVCACVWFSSKPIMAIFPFSLVWASESWVPGWVRVCVCACVRACIFDFICASPGHLMHVIVRAS